MLIFEKRYWKDNSKPIKMILLIGNVWSGEKGKEWDLDFFVSMKIQLTIKLRRNKDNFI